MKFCQTILWNSDHENEVLPVCFVRTRLWKLKFCQFKLQILYCTSVVLSCQLFRLKLCLWLNSICFSKVLYESKFSQLVYFLQPLKVLPSSAYRLGWPYRRWAMLLFVPLWTFPHLGASHIKLLNTLVHLRVYPFLLGMTVTSLCSPLGSNPTWQWSLQISLILLRISTLDWTYFRLITVTFEISTNDKLQPELLLLTEYFTELQAAQLVGSETIAWRLWFSVSRLSMHLLIEYIYS